MTVAAPHRCAESNWPGGSCRICGRKMPEHPDRNLERERDWTHQATRAWHINPDGLIAFSEHRADKGPVRDIDGRDFILEVREELSDARNYLCWRIEQLVRRGDDDEGHEMDRAIRALRAVALAWQELET